MPWYGMKVEGTSAAVLRIMQHIYPVSEGSNCVPILSGESSTDVPWCKCSNQAVCESQILRWEGDVDARLYRR